MSDGKKMRAGKVVKIQDWLIVTIIGFAGAFLGVVFTSVAPTMPLIVQDYGGGQDGAFVARWLLTMPSIGIVVGGPTSGWFVERFGARTILLTCFVIFGLAGIGGLFIVDRNLLLVSRFIVGVMAAGQATAATVVLGDRFTGERRGAIVGFQVALAAIIGIGFTFASGALAQSAGWRAPFALYGAAFAIALLAAVVIDRNPVRKGMVSQARTASSVGWIRPLLPIFAVIIVTMVVSFISSNQVPLLLSAMGASDPSLLSLVVAGTTLATTVGAVSYGKLRATLGASRTSALGGVLQAGAVFFLAIAHGVAPTALASVLLGLGSGLLYPGFSHTILDRAPEPARGRAIGLLFTTQFAGTFLSTALVAPAIDEFGLHDSFLAIAAALLIGWGAHAFRRPATNAHAAMSAPPT
jgi:MFS family permease